MEELTAGFDGDFRVKDRPDGFDGKSLYVDVGVERFYGIVPKFYGDAQLVDMLLNTVFLSSPHKQTIRNVFGFWCTPDTFLRIRTSLDAEGIEYKVLRGVSEWRKEVTYE